VKAGDCRIVIEWLLLSRWSGGFVARASIARNTADAFVRIHFVIGAFLFGPFTIDAHTISTTIAVRFHLSIATLIATRYTFVCISGKDEFRFTDEQNWN
jgi:hypothetical protein